MEKGKDTETVLILVLVVALAVGVYFYVSTKGKNDAIGDLVDKAVGTAEKVVNVGLTTATEAPGTIKRTLSWAANVPFGGGGSGPTLADWVAKANSEGLVLTPALQVHYQYGTAKAIPAPPKLAAGQMNQIGAGGKIEQVSSTPARTFTVAATGPSATSLRKSI